MTGQLKEEAYANFLQRKRIQVRPSGFEPDTAINPMLFPFQRDVVRWALRRGKAALFEDCGLGKTGQECEWSAHVVEHTGKPVLNFAPLAVSQQTQREGESRRAKITMSGTSAPCSFK